MENESALQDLINKEAPIRKCYGCGADNEQGMQIKSHLEGDVGVCRWKALPHHCSYPGYLNGGVTATLVDCHSAWTAYALECEDNGVDVSTPDQPTGWTRAMNIEYLRPIPLDCELTLKAIRTNKGSKSRTIKCSVYCNEEECASAEVAIVMTV